MPYNYSEVKSKLFTEDGLEDVLTVYTRAKAIIAVAGVCTVQKAAQDITDSWTGLAAIDYLVGHGFLYYVFKDGLTQNWVLSSH